MYSILRTSPQAMLTAARSYFSRALVEEHRCFPPEQGHWQSVARQHDIAFDYRCPECGQQWHEADSED